MYGLTPRLRTILQTLILAAPIGVAATEALQTVEGADPKDVEEVVVSADRLAVPTLQKIEDIYQAQEQGDKHFRRRDYAGAYPHLLAAAKRGFKTSQARLAYIYLRGLGGIPYDPVRGVGWLSVAASPETLPWIRRYSNGIWAIVPERYRKDLEVVAGRYREKYGDGATGVSCNRNRRAGTHRTTLTCLFDEETLHDGSADREALRELWHSPREGCPTAHGCAMGLQ